MRISKEVAKIPVLTSFNKNTLFMISKIRWGILGCGRIARKFAADLPLAGNAILVAVASRDGDKAAAFAKSSMLRKPIPAMRPWCWIKTWMQFT